MDMSYLGIKDFSSDYMEFLFLLLYLNRSILRYDETFLVACEEYREFLDH